MIQKIKETAKKLFFPLAIIFIATSFTGAYFSSTTSVNGNSFELGSWEEEQPPSVSGKVVISEVYYDSAGTDTGLEWVELYNPTDTNIDLTGYSLLASRSSANDKSYTFPSFDLSRKSFVLIHINKLGSDNGTELYENYTNANDNLRNGFGSIALYSSPSHSQSTIIDFVRHGSSTSVLQFGGEADAIAKGIWSYGDTSPNVDSNYSMELNDKNFETNQSSGWHIQFPPTPGA